MNDCSLVDLIGEICLVDKSRVDLQGWDRWTWSFRWPSTQVVRYLDRMLMRKADLDMLVSGTIRAIKLFVFG